MLLVAIVAAGIADCRKQGRFDKGFAGSLQIPICPARPGRSRYQSDGRLKG